MIAALQEILNRLCDAYRHRSSLVLLFDYDGTLTPIVEHPHMAVLDDRTRQLLASLADRPRIHVGIFSGRQLDELKSLVRVPRLHFAGTGGSELELRGFRIAHPHAARMANTMKRVAVQLGSQLSAYPGAWLEEKGLGLTVHYRQLPGHLLGSLQADFTEVTRCFAGELRIVQGPRAWEITPEKGWNKGTAVRLLLAGFGAGTDILFYAGDGANDADAIEEVAVMGGITVGIGPAAPSAAACKLPDYAALIAFLSDLDASLEKRELRFAKLSEGSLSSHRYRQSRVSSKSM
jgi:trehalose 6-phosphate phosphatase